MFPIKTKSISVRSKNKIFEEVFEANKCKTSLFAFLLVIYKKYVRSVTSNKERYFNATSFTSFLSNDFV